MSYTRVASLDEVPPGEMLEIERGDQLYAVCNVAGEVRAVYGICPHHGGPLGEGVLDGSVVTCPWHLWRFDTATGVCLLSEDIRIPTYAVEVEAGEILVDLPEVDVPGHA